MQAIILIQTRPSRIVFGAPNALSLAQPHRFCCPDVFLSLVSFVAGVAFLMMGAAGVRLFRAGRARDLLAFKVNFRRAQAREEIS